MTTFDQRQLQADLLDLFDRHGVTVAVGLITDGVAIRSQDKRVHASNIGIPKAQGVPEGFAASDLTKPRGHRTPYKG